MTFPTTAPALNTPVGGSVIPNGRSLISDHFGDSEQHLSSSDRTYFNGLPAALALKLNISDQQLALNSIDGNTLLTTLPLGISSVRLTNVAAGMPVSTNFNMINVKTTTTTGTQIAFQGSDPVRIWVRRWDNTLNAGAGGWAAWDEYGTTVRQSTQTGTAYTLALGDKGSVIHMNNASANTVTVPPNSSVAFPIGSVVGIYQAGVGTTTVAPGTSVIVRNSGTLKAQYAEASLRKIGTDEWVLSGRLT